MGTKRKSSKQRRDLKQQAIKTEDIKGTLQTENKGGVRTLENGTVKQSGKAG